MKVIILCADITAKGGTERAISNIVHLLYPDVEIEVVSLCSCKGSSIYYAIESPVIHCGLDLLQSSLFKKTGWYYSAVRCLNDILHCQRDDIIISYGHNISILLPLLKVRCRKYAYEHINYLSIPRFNRVIISCVYRFLDGVIVLSETAKRKLSHTNKNIIIIPNSLSFPPIQEYIKREKSIIMVGRISQEKGYDRVVPIAKHLREKYPDWRIEVCGDGPDRAMIQSLYHSEGLDEYVHMKGNVVDIREKYLQSSILMLTSYTEALPMVIVEAKACGVPTVGYECEGVNELISDGADGFIIPDNNDEVFALQLARMIESEELLERMAKQALNNSYLFSLDKIRMLWLLLFTNKI